MKVALFKNVEFDFTSVFDQDDSKLRGDDYCPTGFVRISEWIDVKFNTLSNADQTRHQLKILNDMEREVRAKYERRLTDIDEKRRNLLALTAPEADSGQE